MGRQVLGEHDWRGLLRVVKDASLDVGFVVVDPGQGGASKLKLMGKHPFHLPFKGVVRIGSDEVTSVLSVVLVVEIKLDGCLPMEDRARVHSKDEVKFSLGPSFPLDGVVLGNEGDGFLFAEPELDE